MIKQLKLSFLFFAILFDSAAQQTKTFTLEEVKSYALLHSHALTDINYDIEKAELKVKEYLGILLPQVNGELSYTHYGKLPASIIPAGTFGNPEPIEATFGTPNNLSANISLTQIIFNGSFLIGVKGAQEYVELSKQETAIQEQVIKNDVTTAFFNALIARENITIIQQNIQNLEKLIFETEQIYKNGFAEELDVDRLKLSLTNLKTSIENLEVQKELTLTLLKYNMGMPLDSTIEITGKLSELVESIQVPLENRPDFTFRKDVQLMNASADLQRTNIKRIKYEYLPSLVGYATLGSQAQREKFNFFNFKEPWLNNRFFGVQLSVPIWDSYTRKRQIQGVGVTIKQIENNRDRLVDAYEIQYESAKANLVNALNDYNNFKETLALAEKIYKIANIKYKEGIGSSLELKSAQSELYLTQANYQNSMYKVVMANQSLNNILEKN